MVGKVGVRNAKRRIQEHSPKQVRRVTRKNVIATPLPDGGVQCGGGEGGVLLPEVEEQTSLFSLLLEIKTMIICHNLP